MDRHLKDWPEQRYRFAAALSAVDWFTVGGAVSGIERWIELRDAGVSWEDGGSDEFMRDDLDRIAHAVHVLVAASKLRRHEAVGDPSGRHIYGTRGGGKRVVEPTFECRSRLSGAGGCDATPSGHSVAASAAGSPVWGEAADAARVNPGDGAACKAHQPNPPGGCLLADDSRRWGLASPLGRRAFLSGPSPVTFNWLANARTR